MANNYGSTVNFQKIKDALKGQEVFVGYPDGMSHNSGSLDIADIAEINSVDRDFLHDAIRQNKVELAKEIKAELMKVLKGKEPNLNKLGVKAVALVQEFVRSDYYRTHKPNKDSTIAKKKSDKPLIDTGLMNNSLTYTIKKGGK